MAYKSNEERYTSWWLDDLKEAGYVRSYDYEPHHIPLSNGVEIEYTKQLKTKVKYLRKKILQPHVYTPDFVVDFIPEMEGVLFGKVYRILSRQMLFYTYSKQINIEVKPKFDQNNMTREFKINQKWLASKECFVNLFVPEKIFEQTFTPKRYLLTDKSGKPRKIKWKIRTLEEWICNVKGEVCE